MQADSFVHPIKYAGNYDSFWPGYKHLQSRAGEGLPNNVHLGDDYNGAGAGNADLGMDVVAVANGIVEAVIQAYGYGFGKHIFIRHELTWGVRAKLLQLWGVNVPTPFIYSHYAHLNDFKISTGAEVKKGQLIAHLGNSGTQYAHTHLELRRPTGLGYESYPGKLTSPVTAFTAPLSWINQYYIPPFKTIEAIKNPI